MKIRKIKTSYLTAGIVCVLIAAWVASGGIGGRGDAAVDSENAEAGNGHQTMTVRVSDSRAREFTDTVVVRGRTEAFRKVELKAETQGKIVDLPVEKGGLVKVGDPVCRLDVADRQAALNEAKAQLKQRELEFEAATKLAQNGFRSETNVAAAQAALDAATAQVQRMTVEMDNTVIRAPFDGYLEDRPVEIGDYLGLGGTCGTLIDEDPYLVVAEVAERDVGTLVMGSQADVRLASGREIKGTLRYVSQAASEITRTFRIEVIVPNEDRSLRDGLSATVSLPVRSLEAHHVASSALVLNSQGAIGVRTVDTESRVQFHPVDIIGEDMNGMWVTGLPQSAKVIVVGQEFVEDGAIVHVAPAMGGDKG